MSDCDWTQDVPSAAAMLEHLRIGHARPGTPDPAPAGDAAAGPRRRPSPHPRPPAERVTQIADGVYISRRIDNAIDKIGSHMDEFRAVTRALNAAGEIEPKRLLELLDALTGIQTTLAAVTSMITDIAEHADVEMWVDLRAVQPIYEAASGVMAETQTISTAMRRLRDLYAEELAVEHKQDDTRVRTLNPKVVNAAA